MSNIYKIIFRKMYMVPLFCLVGLAITDVVHADFACDLCNWVVNESENQLLECRNQVVDPSQERGNTCTMEDIRRAVNGACAHLPEHLSEPCNDFIEHYSSELVFFLNQGKKHDMLCSELDLCQSD